MRRVALCLAVVAVMALASETAFAGHPQVAVTTVKHYGSYSPHGYYPGYGYGAAPVIVQPMVPGHPAIVYPVPGHPPVVRPPMHPRHRHGYRPEYRHGYRHGYGYPSYSRFGFGYQGKDFGISIRF